MIASGCDLRASRLSYSIATSNKLRYTSSHYTIARKDVGGANMAWTKEQACGILIRKAKTREQAEYSVGQSAVGAIRIYC